MTLAQLVKDQRDEIVAAFVREARGDDLVPPHVSRSSLVDHIPSFLSEMAQELERLAGTSGSEEPMEVAGTAREHGQQRWHLGYELGSVVREYGVLAQCILETARLAKLALSIDEVALLFKYINIGVTDAATEYARWTREQQDQRLVELEFLSEAATLLGSSLDYRSTLARLTRLLVPRLADFCIVNLAGVPPDDVPMAHVDPTKVETMRQVLRAFDPLSGPPTHAQVMKSGVPVLVETPPEGFPVIVGAGEHIEPLQALRPTSWIVVPLKVQNTTLGTMTLARCDLATPYGRTDLLLFSELAHTAASAIDNARVYELSRVERARAEAATRAKDEFVAMVSHELRTPLNVILGWVRLLRSGDLPESARARALEVVARNANAQSQLVSELLDISRVMTGKIRLEPAQVDLGNVVSMVVEDARFALEAKRIQLHTTIPTHGATLRGDGERLKQVVWNLLLNAIKFTPKGGDIWIEVAHVDSDLELHIRDTGIGIPPDFLPYVFDTFRQSDSKTTRTHGGLGLGLSIVKHLVDLHGGSIEARSEGLGAGAAFIVRLPVSPLISTTLGVAKVPVSTPTSAALSRPQALVGVKVLIVDDEEDTRELLRLVVESCEARVQVASSVAEALTALQEQDFELLISDVGMPERDGYDLIATVRAVADAKKANIPALALTAFAGPDDRSRALLAGFNMHLSKPVELEELLTALADLVAHARPAPPVV